MKLKITVNKGSMIRAIFILLCVLLSSGHADSQVPVKGSKIENMDSLLPSKKKEGLYSTIVNFNENGKAVTRFSTAGASVDAHDGKIAFFNGIYYLYGTSYGCGFEWGKKNAPFCGFKVYSSTDLEHWTDKGFLFDAGSHLWQTRCNGCTYGCFRPHVVYNEKSRLYVLWINVYDNRVGFRVFTSKSPVGPFMEANVPALGVNNDAPVAGLNNGDHDIFVDDDGTAYIAYTDWRAKGSIVIEKLTADYLSGTGVFVKEVTQGSTEAPSLFKRNNIYYLIYSDPNCGYCSGTGTSYRTAPSPLGPWSEGTKISDNSCGGQPSFVAAFKSDSGMVYLYGSDLWNNGAKNEALANYYWAPLGFAPDGSIKPIRCRDSVKIQLYKRSPGRQEAAPKDLDNTSGIKGFTSHCDIGGKIQRSQSFIATRTGTLTKVLFTSFKSGHPDADLRIELYKANRSFQPFGRALSSILVSKDSINWAPDNITIYPGIHVSSGTRYAIVLKSTASTGCYGFEYNDSAPYPEGGSSVSFDGGHVFSGEINRTLMFQTFIHVERSH